MTGVTNLRAGVLRNGWPAVNTLVGKTYFLLNLYGHKVQCAHWYPVTKYSLLFKRSYDEMNPEASIFEQNKAKPLTAQGFLCEGLIFNDNIQSEAEHIREGRKLRKRIRDGVQHFRTNHVMKVFHHLGISNSVVSLEDARMAMTNEFGGTDDELDTKSVPTLELSSLVTDSKSKELFHTRNV
jgi:hypothetical protein